MQLMRRCFNLTTVTFPNVTSVNHEIIQRNPDMTTRGVDIADQKIDQFKAMVGHASGFVSLGTSVVIVGSRSERQCFAVNFNA